jgi:hypothetical protein
MGTAGDDVLTYPSEQAGDIGNSPANYKICLVAQVFKPQIFGSAVNKSGFPDNRLRDPDLFGYGINQDEL